MPVSPLPAPASPDKATDQATDLSLDQPWAWWRSQMPITEQFAYFDHAAVGPLSQPAADWVSKFASQASQLGDTVWPSWNRNLKTLRESAATLTNGDAKEFCIIPNTTTGINLVAEGWPWVAGDSVVIPDGEFPSNLFPWLNQQSKGVNVRIVSRRSNHEVNVDDLMEQVDESTKIIALSWVGFATGHRVDLDDLVRRAHDRGVAVFVDAIQGLGVYPLDLQKTPVDFLAADGHKWLLGPEGVGVAMIRRKHFDRLRPLNIGWASVKESHNYSDPQMTLSDDATRFESGSANMVGIGALAASMNLLVQIRNAHGPNAIGDRVLSLASTLREKLDAAGAIIATDHQRERQSGIVNFQIPGIEPAKFREQAMKENVVLSCRGTGVRAAIHAYNNEEDIDRLIAVARAV